MNVWHFILLISPLNFSDSSEVSSNARASLKARVHPYLAKIWSKDDYLGGATILTTKWLLTAAACIDNIDPPSAHIRIGDESISKGKMFGIQKIDKHPQYDGKSNDIAMIKIKGAISIPTVRSSVVNIDRKLLEPDTNYKKCVILSWGLTNNNGSTSKNRDGRLKSISINMKTFNDCKTDWTFINQQSHMCGVGAKANTGACFGDAGGPLMCAGVQVGIMSYGRVNCGSKAWYRSGTVFTRVFTFQKWISDHFTEDK